MDVIQSWIYWGVLQVSAIVLFGLVASVLTGTRHPKSACSIACATVAVAAMLTALAPVPMRSLLSFSNPATERPVATDQRASSQQSNSDLVEQQQQQASQTGTIDVSKFSAIIQSFIANTQDPRQRADFPFHTISACVLVAIFFGLLRLAIDFAFVVRAERASRPVRDVGLLGMVEGVASEMSIRRIPEVRISSRLTDAAVAGWYRPKLVLPLNWKQWSDEELRSVIAHEIAHIARFDALWRAIASGVAAVHCFNPLVHWLLRRVVLYQELAADDMAASVVGPNNYLRALSQLALRRDDEIKGNGRPGLLPVFSGHLVRRVGMLQFKEEQRQETCSSRQTALWSVVASTAIVLLGVATCAVRGFAEPPAAAQTFDAPTDPTSLITSLREHDRAGDPTDSLFDRKPIAPSVIAPNHTGMLAVRMDELLELPELQPYLPLVNQALSGFLDTEFPSEEPSAVDLKAIDWIAGQAVMSVRNRGDEDSGLVAFGSQQLLVTLKRPFDLSAWMERAGSKVKRYDVDGRDVYQIPIPAIGPFPLLLSQRDDTTLVLIVQNSNLTNQAAVEDYLHSTKAQEQIQSSKPSRWEESWVRTDGGIATVVFTDAEIYDLPPAIDSEDELEQKADRLMNAVKLRSTTFAYGFDVEPATSTIGIRLRFTHSSAGRASRSAQEIEELIKLAESRNQQEEPELTKADREWLSLFDEALKSLSVTRESFADGSADVVVTCTLPFDRLVKAYAVGITEDLAMQQSLDN